MEVLLCLEPFLFCGIQKLLSLYRVGCPLNTLSRLLADETQKQKQSDVRYLKKTPKKPQQLSISIFFLSISLSI